MTKKTKEVIKAHILDEMESYQDEDGEASAIDCLSGTVEAAGGIDEVLQGGTFLIYYDDVRKFLVEECGYPSVDKNGEEWSDQKVWQLYKYLMTVVIEELIR